MPPDRDRALRPARAADQREAVGRPACAPRGATPRLQHPAGHGARLRSQGGSAHPDRGREGARVHRLPGVQPARSRPGSGARDRPHHDPHPDGLALSRARSVLQVLHGRSRAPARARPGHLRAARLLRTRVHRSLLRGHGLSRPPELLGQHQRRRRAVRHPAARRVAGDQFLLQHHARRHQRHRDGRPLVAPGRLRAHARPHRSRLLLHRLSLRHRSRERLEPDRHPGAGVRPERGLQASHGVPHDRRRRRTHDEAHRVPRLFRRPHAELRRIQRLLAFPGLPRPRRHRRVLGLPGTGRR